ncbi:MAG: cellulase family glycosylhydrolase [Cyclonatronaceae bacterium]
MKRSTNHIVYAILILLVITNCDTTQTKTTNPEETLSIELVAPENNSTELSLETELVWSRIKGAQTYRLLLSESDDFETPEIDTTVTETSIATHPLTPETTYNWKVYPIKRNQSGPWSEVWSFTTKPEADSPTPPSFSSYMQVHNSNFVVDGQTVHFASTNAYYLPNYEKLNPAVVDRAMDLFQNTGITVIRMWGFYDGFDCGYSKNDSNENVIQTSPGVYSESALRDLDNVIAKGKERGVGFIIPFINYWDELGGICQYNTWAGASNPSTNMAFFLSNSDTQKWYKDYIKMLLNRVNTVTGIAYKDEPAIVAWQIMNEGRNPGANPTVLRDWYREMAQYIKSIDPNHLLSTGEEGFDDSSLGVWQNDGSFTHPDYSTDQYSNTYVLRASVGSSYALNTAIPEIDFGNAHWYPSEYGFGATIDEDLLRAQRAWLDDHQNIAKDYGKPFIIGEFGFPGWGDENVSTMYSALYQHAESIRLDGNLLWQLTADGTKCWEFGGNICYPDGRVDTGLYNDFKKHVANMNGL